MMISNKNCALIVLLLVLVGLPESIESLFSRLKKRSTDDGVCERTTAGFCSKVILDESGLLSRFSPDTSKEIQNHFDNATARCKVLLCLMTLYTVVIEGNKHFPISFVVDDEAFVNAIKSANLVECNDNKNIENIVDATTIQDDDKLNSNSTTVDFDNLSEAAVTEQDSQSIKSNEIDGSLNESKQTTRKGIIDILYTNENYTDAAKSKDVKNEQSDRKLAKNKFQGKDYVSVVNLDDQLMKDKNEFNILPFPGEEADDEKPEFFMDIENKLADVDTIATTPSITDSTENISNMESGSSPVSTDSVFTDSSIDSGSKTVSDAADSSDMTERVNDGITEAEPPATEDLSTDSTSGASSSKSDLSKIGNVLFQLLGETGYKTFACNLSTGNEDNTYDENTYDKNGADLALQGSSEEENSLSRDALEKIEFQSIDDVALPKFPENLFDDLRMRKVILKLNLLELCNFTRDGQSNFSDNILVKINLCSDAIRTLNLDDKTNAILAKYLIDVRSAETKLKQINDAKVKVIRIINLTDYLASTINVSDIPRDLQGDFDDLKKFLLVDLQNEELTTFHPSSSRKDLFMIQLFDFLIQSEIVENKNKELLETFKNYINQSSY